MFVCCECCVLSGRGLCDELITRLEESYRLWCVIVCDLETSWVRRPWPTGGLSRQKQTKISSSTCFEQLSVHPQEECTNSFYGVLSCIYESSLVAVRMCLITELNH